MPTANCGFPHQETEVSTSFLRVYGPTIQVQVGFDEGFKAGSGNLPKLPKDHIGALVDTGATESCIDAELAESLKLPEISKQKIGGISGASVHPVHLAQIRVPTLKANFYGTLAAVDLKKAGLQQRVLLGRDFLSHFRMVYDGRTGHVFIENESDT